MDSFEVIVASSAYRDLRRLAPALVSRLFAGMAALGDEPFPGGVRKLTGSENGYRVRVGSYRILYEIDLKRRKVTVYKVRHRRDAYR